MWGNSPGKGNSVTSEKKKEIQETNNALLIGGGWGGWGWLERESKAGAIKMAKHKASEAMGEKYIISWKVSMVWRTFLKNYFCCNLLLQMFFGMLLFNWNPLLHCLLPNTALSRDSRKGSSLFLWTAEREEELPSKKLKEGTVPKGAYWYLPFTDIQSWIQYASVDLNTLDFLSYKRVGQRRRK